MALNVAVTGTGTHPAVALAGEEAKHYLARMLPDAEGTLTLAFEMTEGAPGQPDAFAVELEGFVCVLRANRPRAALIGVYDMLRRLGCRFLSPDPALEVVPRITPDALRLHYAHEASFFHRGVCIEGADSAENVLAFLRWLPKVGYNTFFLQFQRPTVFLARWYHHERNPLLPPETFGPADAERWMHVFARELARRDLILHTAGHGWTGQVLGEERVDSWDALAHGIPEEKRPLAALVGGKRDYYLGVPANTNLCLANPDAVDAFASRVVAYARANPEADYVHIWLADTYNNLCECAACRGQLLADQYVTLLNEIDRRLTELGLGTKLVFLLYQELLWPPVAARLAHPDRFVLMFAPISRTFEASYRTDEPLPPLPPFCRNRVTLPTSIAENLAFLRAWQAIFPGDSFLYDYPLGRAHYGDFGYLKITRVLAQDIKTLRTLGLHGYVSCQELRAGMPNSLPNYVMGLTLLDEHADTERLIDEYFTAAYPGDTAFARAFLEELSRLGSPDYLNGKGSRADPAMARRMAQIVALCEASQGKLEAEAGPFWRVLAFHSRYIAHLARALEALAEGDDAGAVRRYEELRTFLRGSETDIQPYLDVYRVLEVTEHYSGFGPLLEAREVKNS